jgi:hypothetical protein
MFCQYVFKRGKNGGQYCNAKIKNDGKFCRIHSPKINKVKNGVLKNGCEWVEGGVQCCKVTVEDDNLCSHHLEIDLQNEEKEREIMFKQGGDNAIIELHRNIRIAMARSRG